MYTYSAGSPGTFGTVVHSVPDPKQQRESAIAALMVLRKMSLEEAEKAYDAQQAAQAAKEAERRAHVERMRRQGAIAQPITMRPQTPLERSLDPRKARPWWQHPVVIGAAIIGGVLLLKR